MARENQANRRRRGSTQRQLQSHSADPADGCEAMGCYVTGRGRREWGSQWEENGRRIGGLIAKQTPRWVVVIRGFKFKQTDEAVQVNEHPGGGRLMCYKMFPLQIAKWDNQHLTVGMERLFWVGGVSPSFIKKKGWGLVFFERSEKVLRKQYSKYYMAKRDVLNFILWLLSKYLWDVI